MASNNNNGDQSKLMANDNNNNNNNGGIMSKSVFIVQIVLRSVASLLALAASIVMIKSGQSTSVFGIHFQAKYTYSSAFRFFVGTNIAVSGFSVISIFALCAYYRYGSKSNYNSISNNFSLFLYDMIAMVLLMGGCAAATAIGYVGIHGQDQIGWSQICDYVTKFCKFVMVSIGLSYLAFLCLFALTIIAFKHTLHQSTNLLTRN